MWLLLTLASSVFRALTSNGESLVVKNAEAEPPRLTLSEAERSRRVKSYEQDPRVILCAQNAMVLLILLCFIPLVPLSTPWAPLLFFTGLLLYAADAMHYRIIRHVDISTLSGAWSLLAVFLSMAGILLFDERWSVPQAVGALTTLIGAFCLAYWHRWKSFRNTILQYAAIALVCVPVFVTRKAALDAGTSVAAAFFWSMLSYALLSLVLPMAVPTLRRKTLEALTRARPGFFAAVCVVVVSNLLSAYLLVRAYAVGPISLISIVTNIEPFLVMLLAWVLSVCAPRIAPRETLTRQTIWTKVVSFLLVGVGVSLLSIA